MNNCADGNFQPNIEELQAAWVAFERIARLRALKTDADHEHALQLMRAMWDVVAEDVSHPLSSLFELLVSMIGEYEKKHYPLPQCEPHEMLEFIMEQTDRRAADLADIVDSAQLEDMLAGRKKMDAILANKLAEYFHVTPQMFLPAVK
jgi:HTH-type transcriptional regulator/antitoxin HigA